MNYYETITLKDGRECVLRNGTAEDAREVLRVFRLTHGQTDYLTSYPDEITFTEEQEGKFLQGMTDSPDGIEIVAFIDGRAVGNAGIARIGKNEAQGEFRRLGRQGLLGSRHRKGADACVHRMRPESGILAGRT